jgi:hypothetical protein
MVFLVVLGFHILSGLVSVSAGVLATTARKRPGRHPKAGRVYLGGLVGVFVTATVLAALRWHEDGYLFGIAAVTLALGIGGWLARPPRRAGRVRWHAIGMGGSFIALMTGFYVDNGARLPLWRLLPHWSYWLIPSAVGVPLIWWALRRYAAGISSRPRAGEAPDASPAPTDTTAAR